MHDAHACFWSVYCILVGVALVKILFRLDFSGWTVAFAILLLESGVFLVTGGFGLRRGRPHRAAGITSSIPARSSCPPEKRAGAHHRLFQRQDLVHRRDASRHARDLPVQQHHDPRPGGYSVRAACSTAFGQIDTPKGSIPGFGDRVFVVSDGLQAQLELHCVFGQISLLD